MHQFEDNTNFKYTNENSAEIELIMNKDELQIKNNNKNDIKILKKPNALVLNFF